MINIQMIKYLSLFDLIQLIVNFSVIKQKNLSVKMQNQRIEPQILTKYQIIKKIGSGAYGHVWKVKQKQNKKIYALKKIFQAFQHSTDAQRTFRQISILKKISHKNIVKLHQVFTAKNKRDVYLVFQFMETDLYQTLYEDILQPVHKKYIVYQILLAINYIHSAGFIHRDLKPSNILLNAACQVKVCDFGLARCIASKLQQSQILTEGVATRWYRAPEVLIGSNSYNVKADIWSIGCIIGEIVLKNPLFPGGSTLNQLQRIIQFTGRPDTQDMESIKSQSGYLILNQCQQVKLKSRKQYFGAQSQSKCVDLIFKILKFNPNKRLSIKDILAHEYFQEFYNESDLIHAQNQIELEVNDNKKLTTEDYQILIQQFQTIKKEKPINNHFDFNRPSSASSCRDNNKSPNKSVLNQKQPQRFGDIFKPRQQSFGKLLSESKIKQRSQSNDVKQKQDNTNLRLFSQVIKNKLSGRNRLSSQQNKQQGNNSKTHSNQQKDKQNMHSNNLNQNKKLDMKKFENTTTSRISFQGLKKTAVVKFAK